MLTTGRANCSVYFHIPFCTKKCPYCHFYVVPNKKLFHALLLEGLSLEWEQKKSLLKNHSIVSVYFGGGTPTLFGAEAIGLCLSWLQDKLRADCEITVEANPEEASPELFSSLKSIGVNRISLGVQSLDDRSLLVLERQHSAQKAKQALFDAQKAGIQNVSVDLMYDLPDQTESSWRYTLDALESLPITHLSLYNLTIEPHTSFHKRKVSRPLPEQSLRFLQMALEAFAKLGLERYEISAFAKPGFSSRHNLGYWTFRPFLGFGPSAFSFWEEERFQNVPHLQRYVRALRENGSPIHFREKLPYPENLKEKLAIQLRCKEGAPLLEELPSDVTASLEKLIGLGLVIKERDRIRLTERGMLFYDSVAEELV